MSKKSDSLEPITVVDVKSIYSIPELGIAVEAANVDEAVKKAKDHIKKSKEKKNV